MTLAHSKLSDRGATIHLMRDPDALEAAIKAMLDPNNPSVLRCRPRGPIGPQRDVLGWQDEAGEDCQLPPDEWSA